VLHGERPHRINQSEPQPAAGLPEPPEGLDDATLALWHEIVAELDAMGLAARPDRHQLHAYVEAVRLHSQASTLVQRAGPLIKDRDGDLRTNPAVRIQRESSRTMLLFAREFGLTPAARVGFTQETEFTDPAVRILV
jgi:P27 family predicted phage terminase small subunit